MLFWKRPGKQTPSVASPDALSEGGSDEKVLCTTCGKLILNRMAALNGGKCTACTTTSTFDARRYPAKTCTICGCEVDAGAIKCPQCGKGVFSSSETHAAEPSAKAPRATRGRVVGVVVACLLLFYLYPFGHILLRSPARRLPPQAQPPQTIQVEELSSGAPQSAVLLRASDFEADQLTNDPFPYVITGHAPGEQPAVPLPRIRNAVGRGPNWLLAGLQMVWFAVHFPIFLLNPVIVGIVACGALGTAPKSVDSSV